MKPNGHRSPGDVRRRAVRLGLWRAVAAAPAMLGSLLLLMLASVAVGRWSALFLLTWAAAAAVLVTRVGERMVIRAVCGFHRPSPTQEAALKPAWSTALRVTGTAAGEVELYVQTTRVLNACAAGGRSIAVTSRLVEDYESGWLPEIQLLAVLVHELGHHATGATRPVLLVSFLAGPWRWTIGLQTGLTSILAGRQPRRGLAIVVVPGLAVARALHQGQWMVGGVLVFVDLTAMLCPLADAAISRQSEIAADRFAVDDGLAFELATALRAMGDGRRAARGGSRRLSASHPTCEQRLRTLLAETAASRV